MLEDLDLSSIADARAHELVQQLLNVLEDVMAALRAAQAENQRLRDEINRLKGEQGVPTIKPNTPQPPPKNHSSEQERRQPKTWSKDRKRTGLPLTGSRWCRSIRPTCRRMPYSRDTRTWWCRT